MKLTPVKLYTVNYHGDGALDASEPVWAANSESAARLFAFAHPWNDARFVTVMHPDGDQTYRIDPDPAPAVTGWVPGEPPLDGKHYLVRVTHYPEFPFDVVTKRTDSEGTKPYESADTYYDADDITHHNPTPISLEIP